MLLSEFVTLVQDGSLHQTSVTQESIISYTNLAIQTISDEFDLLSKTEVVTLSDSVTEYDLPNDFESMYSIVTPGMYWRDLQGKIVPRIDSFEVGVNVKGSCNSIFISDNLVFTAPYPITGQPLTLDYKATPAQISNLSSKLPLASQYNSVLMLYVTYLGFQQALGASHADTMTAFKAYRVGVDSLNESGTFVNSFGFNNKFNERGFV